MRTVAHQRGDVVRIAQEILAVRHGALAISAPVKHEQPKSLTGKRPRRRPLLSAGRERAMHDHHWRAGAPGVDEETAHSLALGRDDDKAIGMLVRYFSRFTVAP